MVAALLDRGEDPNLAGPRGATSLTIQALHGGDDEQQAPIFQLLLEAGATIKKRDRLLAHLRKRHPYPYATIALVEQASDAERTSLLVKARRLVIAATNPTVTPSYLQDRVQQLMPRVTLLPAITDYGGEMGYNKLGAMLLFRFGQWAGPREGDEERRKFHSMVTFLLGGGPESEGMPRDVFRLVMDFLMPYWDPLLIRRHVYTCRYGLKWTL